MKKSALILLCQLLMFAGFAQTPSSSSFVVHGQSDRWYPVTFVDDGYGYDVTTVLDLYRGVHDDAVWRGSMVAQVKFHSIAWGAGSSFIDVDLKNYRQGYYDISFPFPDGVFIAGWHQASWGDNDRKIIIWLKGGNTYKFKSNAQVNPTVYDDISNALPFNAYGGPYTYKTAVESYVNIYGRNEQTAFFTMDKPNYFKGSVGIGTTTPTTRMEIAYNDNSYGLAMNVFNTSTGTTSLTGYSVSNASNGRKGQFMYVPSSYANPDMQNTVQISTVDNTKLGFVAAADQSGTPDIYFQSGGNAHAMHIVGTTGYIGIGTNNPGSNRLAVEGTIAARRVRVTQATPWPDYVFDSTYQLLALDSVEAYVNANKHLADIPSAAEVEQEGIDLGDNQAALLRKVEELTLYLIQLRKDYTSKISEQEKRIQQQEEDIKKLKKQLAGQ